MGLQSLSNFALNNNEMSATKGGKRIYSIMTAQHSATMRNAVMRSNVGFNCPASGTTMFKCSKGNEICIEWKNGRPYATIKNI